MAEIPQAVDTVADQSKATRYSWIGGGLIALAFLAPFIAAKLGLGNAAAAGEQVGRLFGVLLLLALIAWLITRSRSDLAKAKGRIVVGILLCLSISGHMTEQAREEEMAKKFLSDAMAFQANAAQRFGALAERFDKVDFAPHVTPAALVSREGIAGGKAAVAQYRALLAERNLLLQGYLNDFDRFMNSVPDGPVRRGALKGVGTGREDTVRIYASLDKTQSAYADTIVAVMDWAEANLGKVTLKNGQMYFQTQEQQTQLVALAGALDAAENAVNAAAAEAQEMSSKAQLKSRRALEKANEILSK